MGKAAVELALKGENAVMPTIVRKSDQPYRWGVGKVAAQRSGQQGKDDAAQLHHRRRLRHHGGCRRYLAPLIRGEDYPPYKNGLPQLCQPQKSARCAKKLKTEFVLK